jgi:hypothetical protein
MGGEQITKKQHYVPRFYLKYFADPSGSLQILNVKNNRLGKPRSCSAVGYSHYFYAIETGVPDEVSQHIEQWLQHFENAIAQELPNIIDKILNNGEIDDSDRYIIAVLMSMLWLRSPNMRAQLMGIEEDMTKKIMSFYVPEQVNHYIRETGVEMSAAERAEVIKLMETGSYSLRFNNSQHLRFMTETLGFGGPGFANMFFGQKWNIHIAKGKKRFITSDVPIVEWWPPPQTIYGTSFLERNKYFALTPEIFLELTCPMDSNKIERRTILEENDNTIAVFNILIAVHACEFAYSGDKTLLEDLISGRGRPGIPEKTYYEQFEHPWQEHRRRQ